jgi:hypothetical protein
MMGAIGVRGQSNFGEPNALTRPCVNGSILTGLSAEIKEIGLQNAIQHAE